MANFRSAAAHFEMRSTIGAFKQRRKAKSQLTSTQQNPSLHSHIGHKENDLKKLQTVLAALLLASCATGQHSSTKEPADTTSFSNDGQRAEGPKGFTPPRLLDPKCEEPPYPRAPTASKERDAVLVRFLISRDGTVSEATVETSSGDARLDAAALDSVRTCRFDAALQDGNSIPYWAEQQVVFKVEPETNSAPNAGEALRLVHAVHLDQLSLAVFQAAYQNGFKEGTVSFEQLACARSADAAQFSEPFVAPLQATLSRAEISAAVTFFESPAGQKYVALNLIPVYKAIGMPPPVKRPVYSEEDRKSIARFSGTAVGAKLLGINSVFYKSAIKNTSNSISVAMSKKCAQ
jgi:TonB family protein